MKSDFKKMENRGWSDMLETLERELPQTPSQPARGLPFWWWSAGFLVGGVATFLFLQSKIQTLEHQLATKTQKIEQKEKQAIKKEKENLMSNAENLATTSKNPTPIVQQTQPNLLKKPQPQFSIQTNFAKNYPSTQRAVETPVLARNFETSQPSDAPKASDTGGGTFLKSEKDLTYKNQNFDPKTELNSLLLISVKPFSTDSNLNLTDNLKAKSAELNRRALVSPTRPIAVEKPRPTWEAYMSNQFDLKSFGGFEIGITQTHFMGSSQKFAWNWGISGSFVLKNDENWNYLEIIKNVDKTRPTLVPIKVDAYGLPYRMREMVYLNLPVRMMAKLDDHWWVTGGIKFSGLLHYGMTNIVNLNSNFYGYGTQNNSNESLTIGKYYSATQDYETVTAPFEIRRFDIAQLIGLSYRATSGFQSEFFYQHGWFSPTYDANASFQRYNRAVGLRLSIPIR